MRAGRFGLRPALTPEQEKELEEVASDEIVETVKQKVLDETFPRTRWGDRAGSLITAKDGRDYVLYPDGSLRRKDKLEAQQAARERRESR